jgi:hypothetical protein
MPGIQVVKPSRLLGGVTRRIQGINSHPDDLKILGSSFRAAVSDAILSPGITVTRSLDEATLLTIPLADPDGDLRQSPLMQSAFTLELDGLFFRHAGCDRDDDGTLTLRSRSREVAKLIAKTGFKRVERGTWTRAEFVYSLVKEVRPLIPFYCPELHVAQPIRSLRASQDDAAERDIRRGRGLDEEANLTAKGVAATPEQIAAMDRAFRAAESYGATDIILVGLAMALINETVISDQPGGLADSAGWLQLQASDHPGVDPHNLELVVKLFVTEGFTGAGSALELSKRLPLAEWVGKVMWMNSATTYPGAKYESEARAFVEAFGGGSLKSAAGEVTTVDPFFFERKRDENTWATMLRLAEEVRWVRFEAAGVVYFIAEDDLLRSRVRMHVSEDAPGIDAINWRFDSPRKVQEVIVTCRAKAWAAPPGSCAVVDGEGLADGRFIVSQIVSVLGDETATITLKRPTKPLPEPAADTTTKTVGGFRGATSSTGEDSEPLQRMIDEVDRIIALGLPYVFGGGHVAGVAPANGPFDCSSFVSRILQVGGFLDTTMATGALASWGAAGRGELCTVFVHNGGSGGGHTIIKLGDRYAECGGGSNPSGGGPTWFEPAASYLTEFESLRHPPGL